MFGTSCTPERPLGALMVSTEGACAAHYQYGRIDLVKACNQADGGDPVSAARDIFAVPSGSR